MFFSFNRKYIKLVKMDISIFAFKLFISQIHVMVEFIFVCNTHSALCCYNYVIKNHIALPALLFKGYEHELSLTITVYKLINLVTCQLLTAIINTRNLAEFLLQASNKISLQVFSKFNPNQAGLFWLCYIWGGGGGGGSPPPPEISAIIRAIATKFCTRVAPDIIYMTA